MLQKGQQLTKIIQAPFKPFIMYTVIAISPNGFLYISNNGYIMSVQVLMTKTQITNEFHDLPQFENFAEARAAFPELKRG